MDEKNISVLSGRDAPSDEHLTPAARDVLAERRHQIEALGWVPTHDNLHTNGDMALAAAAYAVHFKLNAEHLWPWASKWWKPRGYRENLVRAGALILAEIERVDRITTPAADVATEEQGRRAAEHAPPPLTPSPGGVE